MAFRCSCRGDRGGRERQLYREQPFASWRRSARAYSLARARCCEGRHRCGRKRRPPCNVYAEGEGDPTLVFLAGLGAPVPRISTSLTPATSGFRTYYPHRVRRKRAGDGLERRHRYAPGTNRNGSCMRPATRPAYGRPAKVRPTCFSSCIPWPVFRGRALGDGTFRRGRGGHRQRSSRTRATSELHGGRPSRCHGSRPVLCAHRPHAVRGRTCFRVPSFPGQLTRGLLSDTLRPEVGRESYLPTG